MATPLHAEQVPERWHGAELAARKQVRELALGGELDLGGSGHLLEHGEDAAHRLRAANEGAEGLLRRREDAGILVIGTQPEDDLSRADLHPRPRESLDDARVVDVRVREDETEALPAPPSDEEEEDL